MTRSTISVVNFATFSKGVLHCNYIQTWAAYRVAMILPFWFYVKSILADFRRSKTDILTILEALNFDFWKSYTLENVKNSQKFKIQSCSNDQNGSFGASKWPKLISRKIWVWVASFCKDLPFDPKHFFPKVWDCFRWHTIWMA